jgi:hypothetical protein
MSIAYFERFFVRACNTDLYERKSPSAIRKCHINGDIGFNVY